MSGELRRLLARVLALGSAYAAVSLLERMAATAEADAAAARLAAAAADEALFAHLTGPCGCPGDQPSPRAARDGSVPFAVHPAAD